MPVSVNPTDDLLMAAEKINTEIRKRKTYGLRSEEVESASRVHKLVWSNASRAWYVAPPSRELHCRNASKELLDVVEKINNLRGSCQEYGDVMLRYWDLMRQEKPSCTRKISRQQCLDANEILVSGVRKDVLEILAGVLLEPLPLYRGSYESRERGEFSLRGIQVPPAIAKRSVQELDPQTVKELAKKLLDIEED